MFLPKVRLRENHGEGLLGAIEGAAARARLFSANSAENTTRWLERQAGTTRNTGRHISNYFDACVGSDLLTVCDASTNTTGVPFFTLLPSKAASQFVNRTQPWDSALLTLEGLGVPWMP